MTESSPMQNLTARMTAVGITSVAIIAFQLVMMQQFSITQWHHFAQFVIAVALLGFGAAGTALALFRQWMARHYENLLPVLFTLCGLTMALAGRMSGIAGDFDALLLFMEFRQVGSLLMLCVVYLLPFFFGGLAITLIFYMQVSGIGRIYFANMAGSGIGAVFAIVLLYVMPAEMLPGLLALLPVLAGRPAGKTSLRKTGLWGVALLITAITMFNPPELKPSEYKSMSRAMLLPGAEITEQTSGPHGRLQVVKADAQRYAPSLSLSYTGSPPVRDVMFLNGEYFGTLPRLPESDEAFVLDFTTRALPYEMRRPDAVLALNAATGNDAAHALSRGAGRVTAVEPNSQAVNLLTRRNPALNDSIFLKDEVRVRTETVRAYLSQSGDRYNLITLPVLDSFGGSAGVYAVNEQYHLTQQAFSLMWNRLEPDGMISVTAWVDYPLRYALKVPLAFRKLLEEKGIERPEDHIAAVRSWGTVTYVLSKSPVSSTESERIRSFSTTMSFDPLWLPDIEPEEREQYNLLEERGLLDFSEQILTGNYQRLAADYMFHLRPATDNRPFFSHFMKWESVPMIRELAGGSTLPYMEAGYVLAAATFVLVVLVSLILIILPLFRKGWTGRGRFRTFLYFTGTGMGFILFEMVLIQQITLYLGLPVFAAALVLATLLIGSGAGSLYSSRFNPEPSTITTVSGSIILSVVACALLIPVLITYTMGWPLPVRFMVLGSVLLIPAFMMGMMFPLGLRKLSSRRESHIPWACGVDSFFSVTAASLAILISLEAGFVVVMLLSALAYALTIPAVVKLKVG